MENRTARPARSLFGEILDWMLAPLLMLWPVSIAVTYLVAKSIASTPFDHALQSRVTVLAHQLDQRGGVVSLHLPEATHDWLLDDPNDTTLYQIRGPDATVVAGDAALGLPPASEPPQPGVVRFRDETVEDHPLRIAYLYEIIRAPDENPNAPADTVSSDPGTQRERLALIQVAETLSKRSALANDIIKGVIFPQFIILPLVIVLVWFGLARGLAPLHALQRRIHERPPDDLSPLIPSQAPAEIAPLVVAFNELLIRLDQNAVIQKRFIAQAAHQMKTPLAGLRMQAELALRHPISPEVQRSLELIATSSGQAARLVTQLLSLARAENTAQSRDIEPVDLNILAQSVVRDWVGAALDKTMDLGYEYDPAVAAKASTRASTQASTASIPAVSVSDLPSPSLLPSAPPPPPRVQGDAVLLREMLSNLIDNAIRYTPSGGRITVRLLCLPETAPTHLVVEVEDNGPGIAIAERGRVIERFYRILGREGDGSGLGLAIVHEIVTAHAGTLDILDPSHQTPANHAQVSGGMPTSSSLTGTVVRVQLPLHRERLQIEQTIA